MAAVAKEDGRTALVLERDSADWRVREIDLTTGIAQPFANGTGTPRAMGVDPLRRHVFVVSDSEVFRFRYQTGFAQGSRAHSIVDGPRGIASLGEDLVVITGDDALVSIDFTQGAVVEAVVLGGLSQPWGVVVDPLQPHALYVAEHGADRVLALDLATLVPVSLTAEVRPEDVPALGALPFPRPRALALERAGERLLVMTERAGSASLRGLNLRSPIDLDGDADGFADPFVFEIKGQLGQPESGLATGPDRLRIVSLSNTLSLGGGVQQVRSIVDEPAEPGDPEPYDPLTQLVALETGFDPVLSGDVAWRIRRRLELAESSPTGVRSVFVWDSAEVIGGGRAQIKIVPLDADVGIAGQVSGPKELLWGLDVEPSILDLFVNPEAVAIGDLDGDGDLDLVAPSLGSPFDGLTIFFQTSPGQFTIDPGSPLTDSSISNPRFVAIGDLDGDGDMDLVSANALSDNLTIFFQTSPGQFALDPGGPLNDSSMHNPVSVAIADLDGDGDLDLVSANSDLTGTVDNLTIFFQTSPGQFTIDPSGPLADSSIDRPRSVATGDLDGDGDIDLVSANVGSDNLTIFLQTSPGQFTFDPGGPLADPSMNGPVSVAVADLDGDGDMDLVSANAFSDNLTIFFQTSPGQFTVDPSSPLADSSINQPRSVATADFDGDGHLDLVSANEFSDNLTIFFQTSPGQFAIDPGGPLADPSIDSPFFVATGDLDGDGDMDLVSANFFGDNLTIFFQAGPGQITIDTGGPLTDPSIDFPQSVAIGDLDGDGDLDLVSANSDLIFTVDNLTIFFQTSPGQFTIDPGGPLADPSINNPRSVATGDLDGDGVMDLVSANEFSDNLTIFFQTKTSPGQFTINPNGPLADSSMASPVSVATGDLDGDGDLDLVSANLSNNLTIFFQTSPGQFTFDPGGPLNDPSIGTPRSVAIADLDGDGDLDLVSANEGSGNLTIFFQTSPGQFTIDPSGPLADPSFSLPGFVTTGDLDGDGDLDLVSANTFSDNLTIFFQTSPGQFTIDPGGPLTGASISFLISVAIGDLDGDGDLDLVSANAGSDDLTIFFGIH